MEKMNARIARAGVEFMLLALLALVPSILVYIDVVIIGHSINEVSVTEIAQEALLLMTVLIFGAGARRHPDRRGFFALVAGFFACALIRELDNLLDLIHHGFWIWPALAVALVTVICVAGYCRHTVLGPIARFVETRSYLFIMLGLVVLLVFSRTFGSGTFLWKALMGPSYSSMFNTILQEGLETLGYMCVAYGAVSFWINKFEA